MRDISAVQIFPYIFFSPINDGVEQMHTLYGAGLKHTASFFIVVFQFDGFLGVGVQF